MEPEEPSDDAATADAPAAPASPKPRWLDSLEFEGIAVVAAALVLSLLASHLRSTNFNNYVRLADAILHGHLWIDWPGRWLDAVEYNGQHYGIDGPFPVVLLLPVVILFGTDANQTMVAIGVAAFALYLAWRLLLALGVARTPRLFLLLFLFAGTDVWWCAELGDVWFLAHLCAVAATLGALIELTGKRRGWLVALLAIAAAESRNTLVLALPLYAYLLASGDLRAAAAEARGEPVPQDAYDVRRSMRAFGGVLALGVAGWVAYNEAMWGTVLDIGHTLYFHQDSWGQKEGSPFQLIYLPYQLYSFFVQGPIFVQWLQRTQWPYLKVDPNGVALTFTSPALVLAFLAQMPSRLKWALWITTALVAGPSFLYYLNGWYQFGMRHALDFEPYLFVLMAFAVRREIPHWGAILCAYSAIVGAWGVWYWNVFFRTGD